MCAAIMAYFGGFVRALFDLGVFERGGGKGRGNGFPAFGGGVGGVVPDVRRHIFGKINFNIRQLSEYLLKFRIFRTGVSAPGHSGRMFNLSEWSF